jgi:hypothetical protein
VWEVVVRAAHALIAIIGGRAGGAAAWCRPACGRDGRGGQQKQKQGKAGPSKGGRPAGRPLVRRGR